MDISTSAWSEAASGNASAPPDGWPENMPRAAVNDSAREMMAAIKRDWNRDHYTQGTQGNGGAYTLTYGVAAPAYAQGMTFVTYAHVASFDRPTLNVNNLGAKRLKRSKPGGFADLRPGHIFAGQFFTAVYDAAQDCFFVISPFPHLDRFEIGQVIDYAGPGVPLGFLPADGRTVSRSTYADLFFVLGTTYGSGDGVTTFAIPDRRGRFALCRDEMGGFFANRVTAAAIGTNASLLGATGGDQLTQSHAHVLRDPGHGHSVADAGHAHPFIDPGHNHGFNDPGHTHGVYDPGHSHGAPSVDLNPAGQAGVPIYASDYAQRGLRTTVEPTNISIYGSGTGIYIAPSGTGGYIAGATANIGIYPSGTGITLDPFGQGGAQNMPPFQTTNMLIYTGVLA